MITGLALVFAGAYAFQSTLALIIFFFVTGALLIFMSLFGFVYDSLLSGSSAVIAIVVVCCIAAGFAITCAIKKYAKAYMVCFIGAMMGVMITWAIFLPISPPNAIRYLAYAVNALIGWHIFKKAKSFLLKASTAFIGATMFFYGLNLLISKHISSNLGW